MAFGMVAGFAGKYYTNLDYWGFNDWYRNRSLKSFKSWLETVQFKGDLTRELQTQKKVEPGHFPTFKMSVRQKRKLNLGVISAWLQGNHELDEYVIEALSM
jgi:hypothetical protein